MRRFLLAAPPPLETLMSAMLAEVESALGVAPTTGADETPLWTPLPLLPGRPGVLYPDGRRVSPQQGALESYADELGFGGGVGGGKSVLEIGLAVTQHRNSVIFRAEYTQLRGADGIWAKSQEIIGLRGVSNESLMSWRNLPGGRALEFGAARTMKDARKWQGRPHDLKCFDEVTEFPRDVYRFLITWLRTSVPGQRTRVIATFNPPLTEEGQWVIAHWAPWLDPTHPDPAAPGELRWYVDDDGKDREVPGPKWGPERPAAVLVGGKDDGHAHAFVVGKDRRCATCGGRMVRPRSRSFIPSDVEDNPYYLATGYADLLDALPADLTGLRRGDFAAHRQDHPQQIIPTAWVVEAQRRWTPDGGRGLALSQVGNDVSRGGTDEFVIAKRYEAWVAPLVVHPAAAVPDGIVGAAKLSAAVEDAGAPVLIDVVGWGCSVYDQARLLTLRAQPANGAAASKARAKGLRAGFANKRAEWHWRMRELLDPSSGEDLALPPDPQLRSDLCAPRWEMTLRGIKVEDKEQIKARIGRSPDRGEAVILACVGATVPQGLLFVEPAGAVQDELARLRAQLGLAPAGGNGHEEAR